MSSTLETIRDRMSRIPHGKQKVLIKETGLSPRTVNEIKMGKRKSPGILNLEKILYWLEVNDVR